MTTRESDETRCAIGPVGAFARLALMTLATGAALALVGYLPTQAIAGPAAPAAMLIGITVAMFGGWAGSLVPIAVLHQSPRVLANGVLGGLAVRFIVTLGMALAIGAIANVARTPMLIWTGIAQFVVLGVDTFGLIRLVRGKSAVRGAA